MIKLRPSTKSPGTKADGVTRVPKPAAVGTKAGRLEAILRRPEGATIAQLATALDWQPHSVRGAISGSLKKKRGLKIAAKRVEGEDRVYRIVE